MWYIMRKMRNDLYSYLVEDLCFLLTSQSIDWNIHFDINILYGFLEQWLRHIDVLYHAEVIPASLTMLILYTNRSRKSLWYEEKKENNVPSQSDQSLHVFYENNQAYIMFLILLYADLILESKISSCRQTLKCCTYNLKFYTDNTLDVILFRYIITIGVIFVYLRSRNSFYI